MFRGNSYSLERVLTTIKNRKVFLHMYVMCHMCEGAREHVGVCSGQRLTSLGPMPFSTALHLIYVVGSLQLGACRFDYVN